MDWRNGLIVLRINDFMCQALEQEKFYLALEEHAESLASSAV